MIRIVIADDHPVVRQGIRQIVGAAGDMLIADEATDGRELLQRARSTPHDLVLLDLSMPATDGLDLLKQLKRERPKVPVVILTISPEEQFAIRALKAGAAGYVLKKAMAEELIHAIRTVAAGNTYIDPVLANNVVRGYLRDESVKDRLLRSDLSARETEVLRLIAWGYSNKEISAQLNIGTKTVETYKARLMEKLELRSRVEIVLYALHQGWLKDS